MALSMAESLADLHGFRDGVMWVLLLQEKWMLIIQTAGNMSSLYKWLLYSLLIVSMFFPYPSSDIYRYWKYRVHDDVQLCQWLRTKDGRLKLGDFNRAEVMEFNLKKKEYCRYYNGHCYGNVSNSFPVFRVFFVVDNGERETQNFEQKQYTRTAPVSLVRYFTLIITCSVSRPGRICQRLFERGDWCLFFRQQYLWPIDWSLGILRYWRWPVGSIHGYKRNKGLDRPSMEGAELHRIKTSGRDGAMLEIWYTWTNGHFSGSAETERGEERVWKKENVIIASFSIVCNCVCL